MAKIIRIWILGFLSSFILIWVITPFFIDSIPVWEYDPELQRYVMARGHMQRGRSEGWGSTLYGRHGVSAISDVRSLVGKKVAIWGDSFVEGHQLPDFEKLAQQITRICWETPKPLTAVAIAESGRSVSDYYFLMPYYDKMLHPIAHYIIIADLADLNPDGVGFVETEHGFDFRPKEQKFTGIGFSMTALSSIPNIASFFVGSFS